MLSSLLTVAVAGAEMRSFEPLAYMDGWVVDGLEIRP